MIEDRKFSTVARRKLVDEVLEQLKVKINSGQYEPGDRLPTEPELMAQFGVGRSTVREAVKILVYAGILEVKQGDGTYVKSQNLISNPLEKTIQETGMMQIYEVRKMLDLEICTLAAMRRTDDNLRTMRALLDKRNEALQSGNYSDFVESDIAFHISIAQATHNDLLINMYLTFCNALRGVLSQLILDVDHYDDSTSIHEKLYEAIVNQNVEEARMFTLVNLKGTVKQNR
ncbi:FadR/GntR family transcriptional regulator [Paenibacillus tyrfis]|uniref:FadR/GntR family transcriptional regulator n=1 Tax=Paenibacillus tyrfis TaxID=1501230 RepID=UPI00209D3C5C|nr:FadR/GntR family transcriptional regulator [Paenibacillus tyrfis]MCP1312429.1 FadR family transcriptional regulator [Paenibacillus tyrfis]